MYLGTDRLLYPAYGDQFIRKVFKGNTKVWDMFSYAVEFHDENRTTPWEADQGISLPFFSFHGSSPDEASLSLWVKLRQVPTDWWLDTCWHIQDGGMSHFPFHGDGNIYMGTFLAEEDRVDGISPPSGFDFTAWNHVVIRSRLFFGSQAWNIRINGSSVESADIAELSINRSEMYIGVNPAKDIIMDGQVYDIRIFESYITNTMADEIGDGKTNVSLDTLRTFYPGLVGSGTTLHDVSPGTTRNATIADGSRWVTL